MRFDVFLAEKTAEETPLAEVEAVDRIAELTAAEVLEDEVVGLVVEVLEDEVVGLVVELREDEVVVLAVEVVDLAVEVLVVGMEETRLIKKPPIFIFFLKSYPKLVNELSDGKENLSERSNFPSKNNIKVHNPDTDSF